MGKNEAYLKSGRGPESDECLTPRYGVEPIVKYLTHSGQNTIWCPFDKEDSQYVRVLRDWGFVVKASHIENGGDFFTGEPDVWDCMVSNGPFSVKDKVLSRLYSLGKPFALLMPQNALQSIARVDMYMEHGVEYLGFDRRINFYTRGELDAWKPSNHFASGYFCRGVLPKKLIFEKLVPIQEPYK